jgi:hypothetical protein
MNKSAVALVNESTGEITTVATKSKTNETATTEEDTTTVTTTEPKDFGPDTGSNNILAAWQGLYHLFGARVERWDVTKDGVFAIGLTFQSDLVPDTDTVVRDISYRGDKFVNRTIELYPAYFDVQGIAPEEFEDAGAMTQWMAKFFRGAGEGETNRSPQYVKDGIAKNKTARGLAARRGRPPKKIEIESIGSIDESVLSQVNHDELARLQATLARILAVPMPVVEPEAVLV